MDERRHEMAVESGSAAATLQRAGRFGERIVHCKKMYCFEGHRTVGGVGMPGNFGETKTG